MIRKKASLYGFQELSNPLLYDRNNIVASIVPTISRQHNRAKSNFVAGESRYAENYHKKGSHETTQSKSRVKIPSILNSYQP